MALKAYEEEHMMVRDHSGGAQKRIPICTQDPLAKQRLSVKDSLYRRTPVRERCKEITCFKEAVHAHFGSRLECFSSSCAATEAPPCYLYGTVQRHQYSSAACAVV